MGLPIFSKQKVCVGKSNELVFSGGLVIQSRAIVLKMRTWAEDSLGSIWILTVVSHLLTILAESVAPNLPLVQGGWSSLESDSVFWKQ